MIKLSPLLLAMPGLSFAAMMTNNIQGVGPDGSVKPYICVQNQAEEVTLKLAPGESGDGNVASGNAYYVGASLRFGGCTTENTYLGYVGFNLNSSGKNGVSSYAPPKGVHIAYKSPTISDSGVVGGYIDYTPIVANNTMSAAKPAAKWLFAGVNLSGLEFGKIIDPVVIPNLSLEDAALPSSDLKDTQAFIDKGMNTVRVPISWGFIQLGGAGKGTLNASYYNNYLKPLLQSLTKARVNTILDLHAYMRYSEFGKEYSGCGMDGKCPDGKLITDESAYLSVWGQLYSLIQQDKDIDQSYLVLDLMNEPVEVPDDKVFTIQAALIKKLRSQGFKGYILVEGNSWSGLHSWLTHEWVGKDGQTFSNATLFSRDNFEKSGITDLSKILLNVHQYLDSDYSGTHANCLQDLSTTGPNGFNLNAFSDYLQINKLQAIVTEFGTGQDVSSCRAPLQQFMQYLEDNSSKNKDYGFAGWTIWSSGHGWGDYQLRVKPDSYHMDVLSEFLK